MLYVFPNLVYVLPKYGSEEAVVASPTGVRELDTHSSSEADPLESSPPPVSVAPIVLPFLCLDDSESNTEMPERHVSPTPHDAMLLRALTVRKLVRPLPSHRLALGYIPHHLDCFTFGSSPDHSSSDHSSSTHSTSDHSSFGHSTSDHSSSGHSTSGHSSSGHTSPVTTIADSSTPSRFVYFHHIRNFTVPLLLPCAFIFPEALGALIPLVLSPSTSQEFRDSILLEDIVAEDIDANVLAISRLDRGTIEVGVDVVDGIGILDEDIDTGQRELEARSLIASGEKASLLDHVASLERSNARLRGTLMMESARVDKFRRCMFFMERKLRQICRFRYYDRMRFRRLETFATRHLGFHP
ncbi:hypothetical protein Tco_0983130 [Tanacetum coccineum]